MFLVFAAAFVLTGLPHQKLTDLEAVRVLEAYTSSANESPKGAVLDAETLLLARIKNRWLESGARARLESLYEANRERATPTRAHPIRDRDPFARVLCAFQNEHEMGLAPESLKAALTAAEFPGAVRVEAPRVEVSRQIDLRVPGRRFLGSYAAPGEVLRVRIEPFTPNFSVRVGAHSDNIERRDSWPRPPRVSRTFALTSAETRVGNAYGGLVYLEVPAGCEGVAKLSVSGGIEAPEFTLGKTSQADWAKSREAPGPWAELGTGKLTLTVPSDLVRIMDDPTPLLSFWNHVMDACADLATRPRERIRPERMVADVQISAGYMHAGYPIMVPMGEAKNMVDLAHLKGGPWGFYHEIGHNHQNRDWTFAGTGEVTVNLFSLYVNETLCGKPWTEAWSKGFHETPVRLAEELKAGRKPWDKNDLALRLLMYVQLKEAFGWEAFKKVFAEYRDLPEADRPKSDDAKRDQWLVMLSRTVGKNLGPFFEAWGVRTAEAARKTVADLPAWMPKEWPG